MPDLIFQAAESIADLDKKVQQATDAYSTY
jgi:hypothetical protein